MPRKQAYAVLLSMMLVSMISTAGIALPYPILAPLFLSEVGSDLTNFLGLPPKILFALVLAIYPLGLLIGSSVIGALSDFYGRKKVLLVTIGCSAVSYLISAYALVQENFLLFLMSRFITGVFEGNISVARAIAADLHPVIDKTRAFSWIYATNYAGWLLGPLAGGYMMQISAELAFYVAAIAIAFSGLLVHWLVTETNAQNRQANQMSVLTALSEHNSLSLLSQPELRKVFYLYFLITLGLNAFYEFYPLWLVESFSFSSVSIGHSTAVVTAFMIASSLLLVERFKNWFGAMPCIYVSLFLLSSTFALSPVVSMPYLNVYFALAGMLIGLYNTLLPVYFSDRYHHLGQGKLMGLLMSTFCLANIVIALIGGLISLIASHWSLVLGGILMLCGTLMLVQFVKTEHPQPKLANSSPKLRTSSTN